MTILEKINLIKQSIQLSNKTTKALHQKPKFLFFEKVSIPWERVEPSELGFIRIVSWLYVLCIDIKPNNKNIQFLAKQEKDKLKDYKTYTDVITRLRTYFQHQITPTEVASDRDTLTKEGCDAFFDDIIFKDYPQSENDWADALHKLLDDALIFTEKINRSLEAIKEYMTITKEKSIKAWQKELENTHEKYEFELVFRATVTDIGLTQLDAYTLTEQNLNKWRKNLEKLAEGYDFNYELRKIIEQDLIEQRIPPPVNGEDFMQAGVPRGILLRKALELARDIFYKTPCEKDVLIQKVLEQLNR